MMVGEGGVVSGWQNKLEAAAAHVMPAERLAKIGSPGECQKSKLASASCPNPVRAC